MALTKKQIANTLHHNNAPTKRKSTGIVDTILETIKATLAGGEDIKIKKSGQFRLYKARAR